MKDSQPKNSTPSKIQDAFPGESNKIELIDPNSIEEGKRAQEEEAKKKLEKRGDKLGDEDGGGVVFIAEPRPVDGFGTNPDYADWGAAGQTLLRLTEPNYADGLGEMLVEDLPGPREISNAVVIQDNDAPSSFGISDLVWVWGQFIDHDLSLTEAGNTEFVPIAAPVGDPAFDPDGSGDGVIPFFRVDPENGSGDTGPREYHNEITSFLDASMVYGSDEETAQALRGAGGKLLLDPDGFLIETDGNLLVGEVRAAENVALTSMHTLFARNHNWWVDRLAEQAPHLTDDELFAIARQQVEAEIQAITFQEFLPILLGTDAIVEYEGYDPTINPGITVEFSTAAYRFGHSLLSSSLQRLNEDGSSIDAGAIGLRDAFGAPGEIAPNGGIAALFRGLADGTAQELDTRVVEDVRSFLFGNGGVGLDLASLNIQRGRDLGVAKYNDLRDALGLERAESFSDVTSDPEVAAALEQLYGSVDLIDAWVGGLAEDPFGDGLLGELFHTVVLDQFLRIRDGDPFWSQNSGLPQAEIDALWDTTLSDIIERVGDVDAIQDNAFYAYDRQGGSDEADTLVGGDSRDLLLGQAGDDMLDGGAGEDQIEGSEGNDTLIGGADADRFKFSLAEDSGNDVIEDFQVGSDVLVFDDLLSGFDSTKELDSKGAKKAGFSVSQEGGADGDVTVSFGQGGGSVELQGIGTSGGVDSFKDLSQLVSLELNGA